MPQVTGYRRDALRAAIKIKEHLIGSAKSVRLDKLPREAWDGLCQTAKRLGIAQDRGWQAASQEPAQELNHSICGLKRELEEFQACLEYARQSPTVVSSSDIAGDLMALDEEFEQVAIDLKAKSITSLTPPIQLEDVYLGPFKIVLDWGKIGQKRAYELTAEDPQPASNNDDITHPHVSAGELCEGEGAVPISKALSHGRLLDFFVLVRQILQTYNSASAHVTLAHWGGTSCADCGCSMTEDEGCSCERCNDSICNDCSIGCDTCGRYVCLGCTAICTECEDRFCQTCLSTPAGTNQDLCRSCLEKKEEANDAETESLPPAAEIPPTNVPQPPTPAADALCLGEAPIPPRPRRNGSRRVRSGTRRRATTRRRRAARPATVLAGDG
jgi:hypothetical protein